MSMRGGLLRCCGCATPTLSVVNGAVSNAAVLPLASWRGSAAATLQRSLLSPAHARLFSVSAGLRSAPAYDEGGVVVLVKVGAGKWSPFAHKQTLGMHRADLLKALKADALFVGSFSDVKAVADSTISVLKLPASQDEPTAEDASKFMELKGAKCISSVVGSIAADEQVCILVQLPRESASAGGSPLSKLLGEIAPKLSLDDVYSSAASMAATAVHDSGLTVGDEAVLWGAPASNDILRKPLPFDTSNKNKKLVLLELVDPVHASTTPALHERVWQVLQPAFNKSTAQRTSAVLLTGVSGVGKTKVAFDIGSKYAFVVIARVYEYGLFTEPWVLLKAVTEQLRVQSVRRCGTAADGLPSAAESQSAVGALLLLLSCYLEWAIAVNGAAVKANPLLTKDEPGRRVLRETVLRAQRSGAGNSAVKRLFSARLREVMDDPQNVSSDGCVTIPIKMTKNRLQDLSVQLPAMPVVWCYDDVQALHRESTFDNFFCGTFDAPAFKDAGLTSTPDATSVCNAVDTLAGVPSAAASCSEPFFLALPEDTAAWNAKSGGNRDYGWFYGLLVAMRHMIHDFAWGHLLCSRSLRVNHELLQAHSPAQGVFSIIDADVRLDAATIRAWFEDYLTPAAAAGLDNKLIAQLAGRPLYASFFFQQLCGMLDSTLPPQEPKAVVATALRQAVTEVTNHAERLVDTLWTSRFTTSKGQQPHALVAWLYYLQRMGWGTMTAITPPIMSSEVTDAVQRGVLHMRYNATAINLADEPITAAAIMRVGDRRTAAAQTAAGDSVMRALARRVRGVFGDSSIKGTTAEDVVAWTLLRRARSQPGICLSDLLAPFVCKETVLPELDSHIVRLQSGLHSGLALGTESPKRSFLDLLAAPGGDELLLHHTQTDAAGADLAFLVQRPGASDGAPPRQRLVLTRVMDTSKTSAAKILSSMDLGRWYPDKKALRTAAACPKENMCVETPCHKAFRALMASHPDWCDPVRVLVSARPWSKSARETAAWINHGCVPQQPLLLLHFSKSALGVDIKQGAASGKVMHSPKFAAQWWPTRIRHWPASVAHPQSALSAPPGKDVKAADVRPSHRVQFFGDPGRDLHAEATDAGRYTVIKETATSLIVQYSSIGDACRAVAAAEAASAGSGDGKVLAAFKER